VHPIHYSRTRNHVGNVCSTWGREHFKTFDGDVYQFPGMCEYNLASDCHKSYQEFSVHMKRTEDDGDPTVSYVVVTIGDLSFHLTKSRVTVNDLPVKMPYNQAGVQVEKNAVYFKLQSKIGIVVIWNGDDAVMVEVDRDYANRTCGLCGDFNGVSVYNEFILNGRKISPTEFGNNQKVHRPNDDCEDPYEVEDESLETTCHRMLNSESWSSCNKLINPEPYIQACAQDMCGCTNSTSDFCGCSTLSEFSRQCSHAGGQPPNWRTPEFCAKQCPFNMVYEESYSPCMDTCTLPDTSSLCEDHKMDGCFCPPGTVFDDISKRGCIAQSECQCKRNNKIYNTSEVYRHAEKNCTCFEGRWACESLQTYATCAVEEGSHVTSFDGKTYTFHGDCYYTLAKVPNFTIRAQLVPCKSQEFDTCLKNLKIVLNNDRNNVLMFTSEGTVKQNMQTITLPYHSGDVNIFQASSFHMLFQTSFGLQIQIQHVPIMQVYVRLEQSYRAKTRGLCGNYNMVLSDDMKTPQGIVEGTASTFTNSWKANHVCRDTEERLDDPCSLSVENENYAKHWCALLLSPNTTFAQCHSEVDPEMYYKRCIYASCNCEKSEACLCAVFSSYTHACGSKGVFLTDWRENVCDKYTRSCPASQIFSYKHQGCQLTCRSLGSNQQSCTSDFLPLDGCSCSEGHYLNENNICVPTEKCSCYHNEVYINMFFVLSLHKGFSLFILCNIKLISPSLSIFTVCTLPKVFFNCSTAGTGEFGLQCARTCSNLDNDDCDSIECKSGCQCPSGLLDDGKGSCVKENECPCQHDGSLYPPGTKTTNQCNICTCKGGNWNCTEKKCPGTCIIYGSGHYTTFDQKTYGFQGHCDYVAVKNKCGNKTVQDNFKVITENVPCGSTGTTCTKTVKVQLGRMEVKISMGKYEEEDLGKGSHIQYKMRKVGLYLVIESAIGLTVILDKKTTVLTDSFCLTSQGEVCGLCGNFDGDAQNDFTTNGQLTVSNQLEFANSWKVSSSCIDMDMNVDPCVERNNRHTWAKKKCSIITGDIFKECHKKVDYHTFHENCVKDSCACDTGGDCECFCTAVAAYAQACIEAGVCIAWRTPEICPVFCDYYNSPKECKWHYHSCHTPCYKTCLNPQGICSNHIPNLEGCYPVCPEDKPIFNEKSNMCVETCETTTTTTTETPTTTTRSTSPPTEPTTTTETPTTTTRSTSPPTEPNTTTEMPTTTTRSTTPPTEPTTTTETSTTPPTESTTISTPPIRCYWSDWYDDDKKTSTKKHGDLETYENIRSRGEEVCKNPSNIECRPTFYPEQNFFVFVRDHNQVVSCDVKKGLICRHEDQIVPPQKCFNYQIRVLCCDVNIHTTTSSTTQSIESTTTTETPTTTTRSTTPSTTPTTTTTRSTTPPTEPTTTTEMPTTTTRSTTPPTEPTTTTEMPTTTTRSTTPPTESTTTTEKPTTTTRSTTPSTAPTTTTETPTTTTRSTTPSTTTTISSTPPIRCHWSDWYDDDKKTSTKKHGDLETYENIRSRGEEVCKNPSNIECRPTFYPEQNFFEFVRDHNQVVSCDVKKGLICRHEDQIAPPQKCFNYQIRVLCCDVNIHTTTSSTTQSIESTTTTETPTTTTRSTTPSTTPTTTTTRSTTPPTESTTTTEETTTTTISTTPPTEPTTTTEMPTTTTRSTTPPTESTTGTEVTATTTRSTTPSTTPTTTTTRSTTPPTESTTTTETPTTTTRSTTPSTAPTTTTKTPTTTIRSTTPSTTTTISSTPPIRCHWSDWYDDDKKTSTKKHGDLETFENIRSRGEEVCKNPRNIECRPTFYPEQNFFEFVRDHNQVVSCDVTKGLICRHEDQIAPPQKCFNYQIRVLCCDVNIHTTTSSTTQSIESTTTTETPTTTTRSTTPSTTPTTTTTRSTTPSTTTTISSTPPIRCHWSDWYDDDKKTSTKKHGDLETYENIRSRGEEVCKNPSNIECRPTFYPEQNFFEFVRDHNQVVSCDVKKGLICRHEDQIAPPQKCFNYQIRVLCCDVNIHTTTSSTTQSIESTTTTETPTTTTRSTTPSTTPTTTTTRSTTPPTEPTTTTEMPTTTTRSTTPPTESTTTTEICANGKKPVLVYDEYHCCVCYGWGDPHYITFDGLQYAYQGNCTYVLMEEILPKYNLTIYIDNVYCDIDEDVSCPRSINVHYKSQAFKLKNHDVIGRAKLEVKQDGILSTGLKMILEIPHLKVVITFGISGFSVTLPFEHFGKNTWGHCGTCNNNQTDDCMLPDGKLAQSCPVMADFWPVGDCQPVNVTVTPTCKPGPVCNLLQSSVFAECHPFVAPDKFYQACVFDSCRVSNRTVECTSLQTYAAACVEAGVCVNWRNYTTECGNYYCGLFFQFNEKFEYNCQHCVCEESTKSVSCEPKVCPPPTVTNCVGLGFVLVNQTDPANCCCSTLTCPETYMKCPTGKIPIVSTPEGKCCPEHTCGKLFVQMLSLIILPLLSFRYSAAMATMQHSCSCCKEMRSSNRTVDLRCLNGDLITYTYMHVEECGCGHTECTRAAEQPALRKPRFTLVWRTDSL
uniref:Mucin-5AC n=1 Tax=Dicentrarchus labrax TaxID=13489 RepID=A0A8C4F7J5_DICLA